MSDFRYIITTFEVDGKIVGTTWIRRSEGFFDEAFTIARQVGKVCEADVSIYTEGHPQVPAARGREYRGTVALGSPVVMGVNR